MNTRSSRIALRRVLAAPLLVALCAGCAYLPDWPFGDRGVHVLQDVEPSELRVALELPRPLRPASNATWLQVEFVPRDGEATPRRERLALVLVNEGRTVRVGGLASARPGYYWFLFKPTSVGEAVLADLKGGLMSDREAFESRYRRVRLDLEISVLDAQPGQAFAYSVWLQPRMGEEFQALVRDREMRLEPERGRD